jgi:hypothetical protein
LPCDFDCARDHVRSLDRLGGGAMANWRGTVLPPNATVTNRSPIDLTRVAGELQRERQLHDEGQAVPTPEPGGRATVGLALVGLVGRLERHTGQVATGADGLQRLHPRHRR